MGVSRVSAEPKPFDGITHDDKMENITVKWTTSSGRTIEKVIQITNDRLSGDDRLKLACAVYEIGHRLLLDHQVDVDGKIFHGSEENVIDEAFKAGTEIRGQSSGQRYTLYKMDGSSSIPYRLAASGYIGNLFGKQINSDFYTLVASSKSLENDQKHLDKSIKKYDEEIAKYDGSLEVKKRELGELSPDDPSLTSEIEKLEREIASLEAKKEAAEKAKEGAEERLEQVQAELIQLNNKLEAFYKKIEKEAAESNKYLGNIEKEKKLAQEEIRGVDNSIEGLVAEKAKNEAEIETLNQQLGNCPTDGSAEQEIKQLQDQIASLEAKNSRLEGNEERLQATKGILEAKLNRINERIEKITGKGPVAFSAEFEGEQA